MCVAQDTEGGFITHQIKMHAYLQRTTGLVHLLTHPQTKRDLILLLRHTEQKYLQIETVWLQSSFKDESSGFTFCSTDTDKQKTSFLTGL